MANYPYNEHRRRFQYSYFTNFPWLEYSLVKHHAYCLPCFLFTRKPNGRCGSDTFTVDGFSNWKKVNAGKNCAFLTHMGKDSNSAHNFSVRSFHSLKNSMTHIDKAIVQASAKMIGNARQRLKVTIDSIRWLTFQACAFRGHDESPGSINQGNFLELIKLLALYNKEVNEVVLQNAPRNAKYTSGEVQQEILQLLSRRVQKNIIEEIGTSKFCIMVDEARDESKKDQMALVIRFVNKEGFIKERFLDVIHVKNTVASTLKDAICAVLVDNNLNVQDIRGQGYDGASNMRGEWNGLKALILNECPYAYYVHCMAHQLQLALVAASREVPDLHNFFQHANFIINVVSASSKRNDELLAKQAIEIAREIELGELDTGKGANQIGSLQRTGDTRWSSHFKSIHSLRKMFGATIAVLRSIATDHSVSQYSRGDAAGALKIIISFDFVFILHLMEKIMKITDVLCQILQKKSVDILNALNSVSNTKALIGKLRKDGWEPLMEEVKSFCLKHEIDIPDLNNKYVDVTKSRKKHDNTTTLHHYKVDVFHVAIDQQVVELNNRFGVQSTELLTLCASLDPRLDSFDISNICSLVEKFYPADFSTQERAQLESQLPHFQLDVCNHPELKCVPSLADLTVGLAKTGELHNLDTTNEPEAPIFDKTPQSVIRR
ncbi:zinc finger MYM-type protein 1-like isoform X2 [Brachypodium distachyon]|uniref:zinc finger MYM-type protein 1-like isoform X2 n=1 Tax=Brachypodium distachyon TaxID=15368 RepID=UPI00071C7DD4|nr:zinc finger MYM-type protein 1-like isoform X2 [Brachypodium distachyon]|eukprot:XP_024316455.1 zinc finger MYM-type protein 1-like isoform X2 [Brachypodium distachyon]